MTDLLTRCQQWALQTQRIDLLHRQRYHSHTDCRKAAIATLVGAGFRIPDIARTIGWHRSTVSHQYQKHLALYGQDKPYTKLYNNLQHYLHETTPVPTPAHWLPAGANLHRAGLRSKEKD